MHLSTSKRGIGSRGSRRLTLELLALGRGVGQQRQRNGPCTSGSGACPAAAVTGHRAMRHGNRAETKRLTRALRVPAHAASLGDVAR